MFESGMGVGRVTDLPEPFHERSMREFGGESGGSSLPAEKINLGLAETQFPAVLGLTCTLKSLLSRSSIITVTFLLPPSPHYFYGNLDETYFLKGARRKWK